MHARFVPQALVLGQCMGSRVENSRIDSAKAQNANSDRLAWRRPVLRRMAASEAQDGTHKTKSRADGFRLAS